MISLSEIKEYLDDSEKQILEEEQQLFGSGDKPMGPNYQAIVHILHSEPILVEPTLNFLQLKLQQLAIAKLNVLYTPEQQEELKKRLEEDGE